MDTMYPADLAFVIAAAIATVLALASAVALALAHLEPKRERVVRIAAVIEILLLIIAPGLAWSSITSTVTRFGAEGMRAFLIGPAARMCLGLALAVTIANVVALICVRPSVRPD